MRFSYHHAGHCGVPIVLQQCWPQTPWAWRRVTLLLSPVCDVIAPDLPSFAYSSMSENGFDKKTITPRLRKFLQALGPPASCSPATIWAGTPPTPHTGWKKPSFGQKEAMDASKGGSWHFGLNMAGNTSEELERGREFLFVDQFIRREKVGLFDPYLVSLADIKTLCQCVRTTRLPAVVLQLLPHITHRPGGQPRLRTDTARNRC